MHAARRHDLDPGQLTRLRGAYVHVAQVCVAFVLTGSQSERASSKIM
jgi:hypothetical protein